MRFTGKEKKENRNKWRRERDEIYGKNTEIKE
jgi:hypothetical protein